MSPTPSMSATLNAGRKRSTSMTKQSRPTRTNHKLGASRLLVVSLAPEDPPAAVASSRAYTAARSVSLLEPQLERSQAPRRHPAPNERTDRGADGETHMPKLSRRSDAAPPGAGGTPAPRIRESESLQGVPGSRT